MLKISSDVVSKENGDVVEVARYSHGPLKECSRCPCLLVTYEESCSVESCRRKRGFCSYYMVELSLDSGEYPKNCRIDRIIIEEKM